MTHYSSNKWKVNSLAIKCTLVKLHALWCCAAKVLIALVVIHVSSESQVGEDVAHRTPRPKDVCCFSCLWSHSTEVTFNPPDTLWLTVFLIVNWDFWHIWVISLVRRQVWCCMTTIFMSVKEKKTSDSGSYLAAGVIAVQNTMKTTQIHQVWLVLTLMSKSIVVYSELLQRQRLEDQI